MKWTEAKFKLQDGTTFTVVHNLPETGANSIEDAFNLWTEHVNSNAMTQESFIAFVNQSGIIHAMTLTKYNALTVEDGALTDISIMPFGKHKGKKMINIPAYYFMYIYDNGMVHDEKVKKYIISNMEALKKEAAKQKY